VDSLSFNETVQLVIAIATSFAALCSAIAAIISAISIKRNKEDVNLGYKPQFEIITDEGNNEILNIANLNPNYQSYEILNVINITIGKKLNYEKQLTMINGGINFLKIYFPIHERSTNNNNVLEIRYKSLLGIEYKETVSLPIDDKGNINIKTIKGIVFK